MKHRATSSLDTVEIVMAIEEAFGVEIPGEIDQFESQSEMVDRLETVLSSRRPNKAAAALLRQIAMDRQQPELAEGLDRTWRREQIAAVVRELFRGVD
jgi:hypothetical protein